MLGAEGRHQMSHRLPAVIGKVNAPMRNEMFRDPGLVDPGGVWRCSAPARAPEQRQYPEALKPGVLNQFTTYLVRSDRDGWPCTRRTVRTQHAPPVQSVAWSIGVLGASVPPTRPGCAQWPW